MTRVVSIRADGAAAAREALGTTVATGGVAVFPADGLYGLACDPLRADSIARLHVLKGRDDGKPSAVLFFSPLILRELILSLGDPTRAALGALLPGPVTLVAHNPERRYPLACREDPERLGIRLIEGPLTGVASPLFQTSANLAGEPAPSRFEDVPAGIVEGADLAIDGGELTGQPSTVVDVTGLETGGTWKILRQGGMPAAEVERRLGAEPTHGD
ncbi:MAG TPA: Sua5/YciO/YrdC/YwlC family protein [Solirubrobacterales bacterium]|nr:Sua5/YciO/YrdC/YwlC family protein [Solirubrobacterales bacterium]